MVELRELLPLPAADANKYSRGKLLVVGGSTRYPGAAILAAKAAARSGAGYVTLAVPEDIAQVAQSHL
ncbi:MAG: bifunctional ADP-dependent NAD(P)H-hydrate dehydratase/NAD(P)H-hydrate epimerase, partial [Coriobacteriales bacterium]|nr:bifunctional ADP-dependent NAD(P)H-hydrate dehydratase/NAD(P)H-hydrate epimerase [Coriobacteriales bacterium]